LACQSRLRAITPTHAPRSCHRAHAGQPTQQTGNMGHTGLQLHVPRVRCCACAQSSGLPRQTWACHAQGVVASIGAGWGGHSVRRGARRGEGAAPPRRRPALPTSPAAPVCNQHASSTCALPGAVWCAWVHGCRAVHRTVATPRHPRTRIGCMHAQRVRLGRPCIVLAVSHACMPAAVGAPTTACVPAPSPPRACLRCAP
jgi:hypothetical protein